MKRRGTWRLTLAEVMVLIAMIALTFACLPELHASLLSAGLLTSALIDGCA